ncbi:Clavaminate synthase-like protein [Rhodocollybia butyracea]|uniref:Clavaminate synthase-like protein n=1 Tax=Rhodocollybia butyracea TaxID=206335 RepID=A0A9P5QBT5_9AGAR|nr:Clavaminate synthase-like protein [Rhodocollybia butyracea]
MVSSSSSLPKPNPLSSPASSLSLPIINIAPYLTQPSAAQSQVEIETARTAVSSALHAACRDFGFFYLDISAMSDPSEPEELTELARIFFGLPQEEKDKLALSNQDSARVVHEYRLKENVTNGKADNHEGIDFYRPVDNPDKTKPLWGENQWPQVPQFREKYEAWVEKMKMLGLVVMEAMASGLGMSADEWKDLRGQVDNSFWVMRAIGYPPLPNDHDGFSCGAHKDYGCLTFLYADPTPNALQVFLRRSRSDIDPDLSGLPAEQGDEEGVWITADPISGCVVCNIGESESIWSGGLYKSTLHRVVHRGSNYRNPFFFEPNFNALVKPLAAALRTQERENKDKLAGGDVQAGEIKVKSKEYKPTVYGEFLMKKVGNNFADGKGKYD